MSYVAKMHKTQGADEDKRSKSMTFRVVRFRLPAGTTDPATVRLKDITISGFSAIVAKPPNTAVGDDSMTDSQLNMGCQSVE